MRDITHKFRTLREATARSRLTAGEEGLSALENKQVPKGNPYEIAKSAGMMAAKRTDNLIPHCHNIPIENVDIEFSMEEHKLTIDTAVAGVARTGMEMEALTCASVTALTLYDLLKPIDDDVEIGSTELLSKTGGKSDYRDRFSIQNLTAAVLVCSDGTYEGTREDKSGNILKNELEKRDFEVMDYTVLPDEQKEIRSHLTHLCDEKIDFVLTTGGTGPAPRDVTVEATQAVLDREIPGIAEAMRSFGQERTPYAMFSRGLAGQRGKTLIINFPGSSNGVREGLDAIFPGIKHFFKMRNKGSGGHEDHNK